MKIPIKQINNLQKIIQRIYRFMISVRLYQQISYPIIIKNQRNRGSKKKKLLLTRTTSGSSKKQS
ncbi:hypothetical protein pb186bvf_006869 [Paramecium bursaria]